MADVGYMVKNPWPAENTPHKCDVPKLRSGLLAHRCGTGRWSSAACFHVLPAHLCILFGGGFFERGLASGDGRRVHAFEVRSAPATARPGTEAFAQLRRPPWFFNANEVQQLALRHMKAKTDFLIELHRSLSIGFKRPARSSPRRRSQAGFTTSSSVPQPQLDLWTDRKLISQPSRLGHVAQVPGLSHIWNRIPRFLINHNGTKNTKSSSNACPIVAVIVPL